MKNARTTPTRMEFARWHEKKGFTGIIFRRNSVQLRDGGLWDESSEIYKPLNGHSNEQAMTWRFPSGAKFTPISPGLSGTSPPGI